MSAKVEEHIRQRILRLWLNRFGHVPSPGLYLEDSPGTRVRIHYLPGDLEFPRHRHHMKEVLRRYDDILTYVLGERSPYILILSEWDSEDLAFGEAQPFLSNGDYRVLCHQGDGEGNGMLWYAEELWLPGTQAKLLQAIPEETISGIAFIGLEREVVARPYPGGIYIDLPSEEDGMLLESRFADWLPGASTWDHTEMVRVACDAERAAISALVAAESSIYLNEDDCADHVRIRLSRATDHLLDHLSELEHLQVLWIQRWHCDESAPEALSEFGIRALSSLCQLRFLRISNAVDLSKQTIAELRRCLPECDIEFSD